MASENYIVINGKRAELTEEQLRQLGIKTEEEKKENLFRRNLGQLYYYITPIGVVNTEKEMRCKPDDNLYKVANYCTDKELLKQRALHETLDRLLWRYSMEHKGNEISWDKDSTLKYYFVYDHYLKTFLSYATKVLNQQGSVYFYSREIANAAIEEVVKPFMAEHPDFVW